MKEATECSIHFNSNSSFILGTLIGMHFNKKIINNQILEQNETIQIKKMVLTNLKDYVIKK
jgi:hypothetical protein